MATKKLFIGYRTKQVEGTDDLIPEFKAPSTWKDQEKIRAEIESKRQEFLRDSRRMPYTGTFDEVFLVDPTNSIAKSWSARDGKKAISAYVATFLTAQYPGAWSDDVGERKQSSVVFFGFDPKRFLKILGLECSMPENGRPLPPGLWYANSDHRDIGDAVAPNDYVKLPLPTVLKRRRPIEADDAEAWDKLLDGWTGPHQDPQKDVSIAIVLAVQLGFVHPSK